jgi:excisionase family DNA binding protein
VLVSVLVTIDLNGARVPVTLDDAALVAIAAEIQSTAVVQDSPYMTIPEAAAYMRCSRQRIDDLLSQRRLTRVKDGRRTLIRRDEIETYLNNHGRRP